jgi:phospholipid/cholesterol/gamma-HCH transport system ATP-binding protein
MSETRKILIEARDLTIGYGDRLVLERINFKVFRGEVFAVLGASGSGKSTLLKHLIGLYAPVSGDVLISGESLVHAEGEDRRRILRRFGVLYQSGALFGSLTTVENVRLPLDEFTELPEEAKDLIALSKLRLVGLETSATKLPADLSGGMQKRAGIARAIVLDPCVLFLDEPSAGLDPITSAGLDALIHELARGLGITFVMVTHELASIFSVADRVVVLDPKERAIVAEGPPAWLRENAALPWVRQFLNREKAHEHQDA